MTPAQYSVELWPKIKEYCPEVKFQIVPFENTQENARELLTNLGKTLILFRAGLMKTSGELKIAGHKKSKMTACAAHCLLTTRLIFRKNLNYRICTAKPLCLSAVAGTGIWTP